MKVKWAINDSIKSFVNRIYAICTSGKDKSLAEPTSTALEFLLGKHGKLASIGGRLQHCQICQFGNCGRSMAERNCSWFLNLTTLTAGRLETGRV